MIRSKLLAPILIVASSFALLYCQVLGKLVHDWANDDNYSHGFLVAPMALYFAWERRRALLETPPRPSWAGLAFLAGGMILLAAGVLGAELFLPRISMLGTLTGTVLFLLGWRHLKILAFPMAFMLLMIPIPAIIFNQIAFPLQLIASRVGEQALSTWGVPVLREGNLIVLANTTLEVAEACSGIRSLISLLTLAIVFGYFSDPRGSVRVAMALAAAHYYGVEAATGFFHTFSGWLVFGASFALLFVVMRAISWILPRPSPGSAPPMATASFGVQQ